MAPSFLNYHASEAAIAEVRSFHQRADEAAQGLRLHTHQISTNWEGTSSTSFVEAMAHVQTCIQQTIDHTAGAAPALAAGQEQAHHDERAAQRREDEARRAAEQRQHAETVV